MSCVFDFVVCVVSVTLGFVEWWFDFALVYCLTLVFASVLVSYLLLWFCLDVRWGWFVCVGCVCVFVSFCFVFLGLL